MKTLDTITDDTTLDCGHKPSPHAEFTTGYGRDKDDKTFCYDCAAEKDREQLRTGVWTGYVTIENLASNYAVAFVSNWPGSLRIRCESFSKSKYGGGFGSQRTDVWFTFEGVRFHGVNRSDSQIVRCRKMK